MFYINIKEAAMIRNIFFVVVGIVGFLLVTNPSKLNGVPGVNYVFGAMDKAEVVYNKAAREVAVVKSKISKE